MVKILKWSFLLVLLFVLLGCDKGQIFHRLRPNSVVLAFGDSLTSVSYTHLRAHET